MKVFRGTDISLALPEQVLLMGILWVHDEEDVVIELSIPARPLHRRGRLRCIRASDVEIHLDSGPYPGVVPSGRQSITWKPDGRFDVVFDLSPTGSVSLRCHRLRLECEDL